MKFLRFSGFFILLSFIILSCKKDEGGSFTIHFKATYDGSPLPMFVTKPYGTDEFIRFTHLSFYVSDLALVKETETENLKDITLVDLSFDDLAGAEDGYVVTVNKIPAESYSKIIFGIGVPPDLNQQKPADFPSSNPLSNTGYYWQAWQSFIFSKTEGNLDTLGNGTFDLSFAFHTGSDPLFRSLEGPVPIVIEDGKTTELTIAIDYKKLMDGINIVDNPVNHNPTDTLQIQKIVNNLSSAVTLIQ